VIERQLAALDSLIGRSSNGNGAGVGPAAAEAAAPEPMKPSEDGVIAGS
jgi:hypothetical protein